LVFNGLTEMPALSGTREGPRRHHEAVLGCYTPYRRIDPTNWEARPPGATAIGGTCDPMAADGYRTCRSHVCAGFAPLNGQCTEYCDETSDCPPGWSCRVGETSLTSNFLSGFDIADQNRLALIGVCSR